MRVFRSFSGKAYAAYRRLIGLGAVDWLAIVTALYILVLSSVAGPPVRKPYGLLTPPGIVISKPKGEPK